MPATDNGSNFIGAQRELKDLYDLINTPNTQNDVDSYCTAHHIQWTHTPARSPHFGGLWEAAVKSMKQLFTKVVGPHNLFMDELYSLTVEIEAALNSRPLTPLADDGIEVLTPGHFLIVHTYYQLLQQESQLPYSLESLPTPRRRPVGEVEQRIHHPPTSLHEMPLPSTFSCSE